MKFFVTMLMSMVSCLDPSIETAWVWGKPIPEDQIWKVNQMGNSKSSYIRLEYYRNRITIDMVKKGFNWDASYSFCKQMLPATMAQFIETNNLVVGRNLTRIEVYNAAIPRTAGCRCYIRTMMSFGFRLINRFIIQDEEDLNNICGPAYLVEENTTIVGEILRFDDHDDVYQPLSPFTQSLLEQAYVYNRIEY